MAKTINKTPLKKAENTEPKMVGMTKKQFKILLGCLLVLLAVALFVSFVSFFVFGQFDQSAVGQLSDRSTIVQNWLGKIGAFLADLLVYKGFGIAAFFIVKLLFLTGVYMVINLPLKKLRSTWFWDLFAMIVLSVLFGFFASFVPELGGVVGFEMNLFLQDFIGKTGTILVLIFGLAIYGIFKWNITPDSIKAFFEKTKNDLDSDIDVLNVKNKADGTAYILEEFVVDDEPEIKKFERPIPPIIKQPSQFEINKADLKPTIANSSNINLEPSVKPTILQVTPTVKIPHEEEFVIEKVEEETIVEENLASRLVADFGLFDPTLDLSNYKFPTLDLLKEYTAGGITINQQELEDNKNNIVETLRNYKIEIAQIKATVGPSVTLYEIVPEAGIRISKIKSLDDDIALSLAALGIRIIAPIPGKGTIGIEVPNKNPTMVSMKSVIG